MSDTEVTTPECGTCSAAVDMDGDGLYSCQWSSGECGDCGSCICDGAC